MHPGQRQPGPYGQHQLGAYGQHQPGPYAQGPYGQQGPPPPAQPGPPPRGPYGQQGPYAPPPRDPYVPQQPYPPQQPYAPQQPPAPHQPLGDGRLRIDPNLTADQRTLVVRIQKWSKLFAYGFVLGIPLASGGAHYGVTRAPVGFAAAAGGLALAAVGVLALSRMQAMKRQLRLITPDAWRSPAAHLPGARKAATVAAYVNGVLVLLSFGATGWLLVKGADWGAYGNSFGFGALMTGAFVPFAMGLGAATTVPQLLRVVPAGAKVGRALYSVILVLAATVTGEGIKSGAPSRR
ncbi:hypothetical protein [Streptomyces sp. NPDC021356]|uniref:hypothetical protein n=1 Tax=Streptomyces sp. NPDC021356 TaxID=3154900 RepID=UPI0033E67F19